MKIYLRDRILLALAVSVQGRAYPANRLWLWLPWKYSRRKFCQLTARLSRQGIIERTVIEGEVNFRLASAGKKLLSARYPAFKWERPSWDGFWRLVTFDIPESRRKERDELRRRLIKLGFGELQNSLYISAYDFPAGLLDWLWQKDLKENVFLMESKQKYLGEPKALARKVWRLEQLNYRYRQIVDKMATKFGIRGERKRLEFYKQAYEDFLEAVLNDPFLPKELLSSDWEGERARQFVLGAGAVRG